MSTSVPQRWQTQVNIHSESSRASSGSPRLVGRAPAADKRNAVAPATGRFRLLLGSLQNDLGRRLGPAVRGDVKIRRTVIDEAPFHSWIIHWLCPPAECFYSAASSDELRSQNILTSMKGVVHVVKGARGLPPATAAPRRRTLLERWLCGRPAALHRTGRRAVPGPGPARSNARRLCRSSIRARPPAA
jgi:hypothetical protein